MEAKTNEEVNNINKDKMPNILKKAFNMVFSKSDEEFTAERAWLKSTYGSNINYTTEERIAHKQKNIQETIKSKFRDQNGINNEIRNSSYRCVIDIEEDLEAYKDVILKPFIDNGFKVINLSEKIEDIGDENVYLISWKNIFKEASYLSKTDE